MLFEPGQQSVHNYPRERSQGTPSYALKDLDSDCRLRHSISFGDIEQLSASVSDGARPEGRNLSPSRVSREPAVYNGQASYSSSMLFRPSTVRTYPAKDSVQVACENVNTFPHLPHVPQQQPVVESAVAAPASSLFSRLPFLSFTQSTSGSFSAEKVGNQANEYQPHPLTRSVSEAMLPSLDHTGTMDTMNRSRSLQKRTVRFHNAAGQANSCAHPLTRYDFTDSEGSTPCLSPRTPAATAAQPVRRSGCSSQTWQDDTHLSVRTCVRSDTQDSPLTSPSSLASIGSFFSGLLPLLAPADPSSREGSISVDDSRSLGVYQASTCSSVHSASGCFSRPIVTEPVSFHITQQACRYSVDMDSSESSSAVPLHSTAFDVNLPSFPLDIAVLPNSCAVDSFCITEEELVQSTSGCMDAEELSDAPASNVRLASTDAVSLASSAEAEISGLSQGRNTSSAIKEQVPEQLLAQLVAILGNGPQTRSAQAASVQAAMGPGMLCGPSDKGGAQLFELVHTQSDKATGLTFTCERRPLRKNLFMWRTRFRIPHANIDTMQTYMLNDQIVRNSNASMMAYVRLEDESLATTSTPSMHQSTMDEISAVDSGFMYSKIKFPVIGARQYVSCRRIWHRPAGEGFYIVSTACQKPEVVSQAKALDHAQGLGDKAWSTDFWAGYMVRPFEENGVAGVEVASITFDDLGLPAFVANGASATGLWAGAKSFADGFRSFEETLASCRRSGQDIFLAVEGVHGQGGSVPENQVGRVRGCNFRLRRIAALCLTVALVMRRRR